VLEDEECEWGKAVLDARNVSVWGDEPGPGRAELGALEGWGGAVVNGQWVLLKGNGMYVDIVVIGYICMYMCICMGWGSSRWSVGANKRWERGNWMCVCVCVCVCVY
jgi:hypothetical protein